MNSFSSRSKARKHAQQKKKKKTEINLEEYIRNRDYTGAIAILEFNRVHNRRDPKFPTLPWLAYCAFHLGDYEKAATIYQEILDNQDDKPDPNFHTCLACCYFYLGKYKEAEKKAEDGPSTNLQNRLLFHIAHKHNDESKLMTYHQQIQETIEDQLSLASIHYLRHHFQEATDIYKRILLENSNFLALQVYIALCYYKLDYYDVSLEVLNLYLQHHPDSAIAINLKACNNYRLYTGKLAEQELKTLVDLQSASYNYENDLVKHNLVVFRNGENALQVLPALVDIIPEARLNLVIYYLKHQEIKEAYNLIKDLEPVTPQEYTLKGVVNAAIGQMTDSKEHLKRAQQFFQVVGASASECDTIPGRQCMASCFFILKQFEDVLIYLKSIKSYFYNNDDFNWNYGLAQAAAKHYKEAEETLLQVQSETYKQEYCYRAWLARCYIYNKKARYAYELYLKMEATTESFSLLQLIANDCYNVGAFFYAVKAFDVLERLDPDPSYVDGKKGACVGVFQQVIAGKENPECLSEVIQKLRNTSNNHVDYILRVIKAYCKDKKISI